MMGLSQDFIPYRESLDSISYLKKPLQPPDLENTLPNQHAQLEDTPPLDSPIRTLRRIPMRPLPNHDVRLLIFDLRNEFRQLPYCNTN